MGKAIFITGDRGKVQLFYCIKLILWIQFEDKGQASWGNPSFLAIFLAPKKFSSELASTVDSWSRNPGEKGHYCQYQGLFIDLDTKRLQLMPRLTL